MCGVRRVRGLESCPLPASLCSAQLASWACRAPKPTIRQPKREGDSAVGFRSTQQKQGAETCYHLEGTTAPARRPSPFLAPAPSPSLLTSTPSLPTQPLLQALATPPTTPSPVVVVVVVVPARPARPAALSALPAYPCVRRCATLPLPVRPPLLPPEAATNGPSWRLKPRHAAALVGWRL